MPTWSNMRSKLEKEYLALSLRGRLQYFVTSYNKCPDHYGRAAVLLDGTEILKSSHYEYYLAEGQVQSQAGSELNELSHIDRYSYLHQQVLNSGNFNQYDFYHAFHEFDNQSIEKNLLSSNPIVRMFALLDRRVGKRRLASLKDSMEKELEWIKFFYELRLTAEKITDPSSSQQLSSLV